MRLARWTTRGLVLCGILVGLYVVLYGLAGLPERPEGLLCVTEVQFRTPPAHSMEQGAAPGHGSRSERRTGKARSPLWHPSEVCLSHTKFPTLSAISVRSPSVRTELRQAYTWLSWTFIELDVLNTSSEPVAVLCRSVRLEPIAHKRWFVTREFFWPIAAARSSGSTASEWPLCLLLSGRVRP